MQVGVDVVVVDFVDVVVVLGVLIQQHLPEVHENCPMSVSVEEEQLDLQEPP
jgi:hypothetical protein